MLIIIDQWIRRSNYKKFLGLSLAAISLSFFAFIAQASWQYYLNKTQVYLEWTALPTWPHIIKDFFGGHMPPLISSILKNFYQKTIAPIVSILLCGFSSIWIYYKIATKTERKLFISVQLVLCAGFVAYLLMLLLMYCYTFSNYEGLHLASFKRYYRTYEIIWLLVLFSYFWPKLTASFSIFTSKIKNLVVIVLLFLFMTNCILTIIHNKKPHSNLKNSNDFQISSAPLINTIKAKNISQGTMMIVWQNNSTMEKIKIAYDLLPLHTAIDNCWAYGKAYSSTDHWTCNVHATATNNCWHFGKRYDPTDPYTCDLSTTEFLAEIKKNQYLLIAYSDKEFWDTYGSALQIDKNHLKPLVIYHLQLNHKDQTIPAYLFSISEINGKVIVKNLAT